MVSTPELLTENSPITVGKVIMQKKPSARKFLSQFLVLLDVKQKTAVLRMGALKKNTRKFKHILLYVVVFISGGDIKNH